MWLEVRKTPVVLNRASGADTVAAINKAAHDTNTSGFSPLNLYRCHTAITVSLTAHSYRATLTLFSEDYTFTNFKTYIHANVTSACLKTYVHAEVTSTWHS